MTWTAPVSPVSGTVITVAWATANVVNPQNWLRLMTGNADPPGSFYVVVSSSPSATAWGKITSDVIADGAILPSKLTFTPVDKAGDTHIGTLQSDGDLRAVNLRASADVIAGQRVWASVNDGTTVPLIIFNRVMVPNLNAEMVGGRTLTDLDNRYVNLTGDSMSGPLTVIGGDILTDNRLRSTVSSPTPPLLVNSAALVTNLNAEMIGGQTLTALDGRYVNASGDTMTGNLTVNGGDVNTNSRFISTVSSPTAPIVVSSAVQCPNLNASQVGGRVPTATPTANAIPIADAGGKLDAWISPSGLAGVPSGLIAAFATAAAIASGWTRYTAADGRLLIGAGTSFSVTWTEATSNTGSWSHDHVTTTVTAASTFTGTGPTTTAADATHVQQSNVTTPNPNVSLGTHTHTMTVPTGTVSTTLTGNVGDTSWQPAMRCIVWAQKT